MDVIIAGTAEDTVDASPCGNRIVAGKSADEVGLKRSNYLVVVWRPWNDHRPLHLSLFREAGGARTEKRARRSARVVRASEQKRFSVGPPPSRGA